MFDSSLIYTMFVIFTGASIVATLALYTGQAILVGYILLGVLLGPNGFALIADNKLIDEISHIGIIFLLYLLGLNLHPQSLWRSLKKTAFVTVISSLLFSLLGFLVAIIFSYSLFESMIIGVCMMFSSTILGLKLMPATVLHHKIMGQFIISILLLQDLLAIAIILIFDVSHTGSSFWLVAVKFIVELPALVAIAFLLDYFVVHRLFKKFDQIKEYVFLLAIGWCLGITELSHTLGLSHEIGAFIAGIIMARSSIALYISENLRPLRDFFLILFFFALGASFNFNILPYVLLPAIILVTILMTVKPLTYDYLLKRLRITQPTDNHDIFCREIGVRLGQLSEFSLLIVLIANNSFELSNKVMPLVLTATVLSFIVSSYWIIMKYPTPLASRDELRRD